MSLSHLASHYTWIILRQFPCSCSQLICPVVIISCINRKLSPGFSKDFLVLLCNYRSLLHTTCHSSLISSIQRFFFGDSQQYAFLQAQARPTPNPHIFGRSTSSVFYFGLHLRLQDTWDLVLSLRFTHSPWSRAGGPPFVSFIREYLFCMNPFTDVLHLLAEDAPGRVNNPSA